MTLYRATRNYQNNALRLDADMVVELDDATAEHVERDSAGTLVPLTPEERQAIADAVDRASEQCGARIRPNWGPYRPQAVLAHGGGPAMSSGNMSGLIRG